MKLVNLPGIIYQLNILAEIQPIDITSEVILDSIFYKALNKETTLDLSYSSLTSPALILVSKIVAATSMACFPRLFPHILTVWIMGDVASTLATAGPYASKPFQLRSIVWMVDDTATILDTNINAGEVKDE